MHCFISICISKILGNWQMFYIVWRETTKYLILTSTCEMFCLKLQLSAMLKIWSNIHWINEYAVIFILRTELDSVQMLYTPVVWSSAFQQMFDHFPTISTFLGGQLMVSSKIPSLILLWAAKLCSKEKLSWLSSLSSTHNHSFLFKWDRIFSCCSSIKH